MNSRTEQISSAREGMRKAEKAREKELRSSAPPTPSGHGPQRSTEKVSLDEIVPTLKKMLAYARPYWAAMIVALLLAIIGAVLAVISPDYLGDITDTIEVGLRDSIDMGRVRHLSLIFGLILAGSFVFSFAQARIMAVATQRTSQIMRREIDHKIDRMPLSYFDRTSYGDTLSRVTNDVDTLSQTLNSSISNIITGVVTIIGSAVMMFVTEWRMALSGIAAALVGFMLALFIMTKSQPHFVAQQRKLGALNGHVEETFAGHNVVRAFNAEKEMRDEFHARNMSLFHSSWRAQFLSGLMMPIMTFVGNLGYVVVCIVGAVLVINGVIPIGVIVSFMIYIRLFTNPLSNIAQAATSFQSASAAGTRVFELLEEEELADESEKPVGTPAVRGDVTFENVRFGYSPDREIIHGFSARVKAGEKVAIVGPTGAGKTTMVNLLMRFYEVDGGRILIDSVPTTDMRREDVDSLFSMVLQDTWLFEGTLRENIVYRTEGVSQERLDAVIDEVGLRELVQQLPQGYDTVMGEDTQLSAGQKQLVTIARAMIADNPLLILDEATSSIDTRTEIIIQEALDSLMQGRTSFVIAHRLSTIRNADVIFVMRDGDIVETGKHDELLAQGGFYSELYNSQFDPVGQGATAVTEPAGGHALE
ncbi:ABC transporter ATP-binding protein [Actinobaculum sp. 352]|uniref:ABC transporter ATP-binding protein n=1 Tax=Actinobaculum sp. 352 TaxID=2490946 RepID=UPI000F7F8A2A|nr:ABC transporter ATP-binding protein [Actinobaculum sp. 352]RTE47857.1 ABC transporter ATP-binding protein [Actinobaculum sp. 352]